MPQAVSLLGRVMAAALAAVGMELAFAYLWPAPRQPEFDPSGTFGEEYPGPPIRLVALGDSTLTAPGVAAADEIWIRQVARRLADATRRPIELRSFGVSGSTSLDVLVEQLPEAIEFGPHLAIVSVGANDVIKGVSLRKLHDNLDRIVAALKGTGALVILSGVGAAPTASTSGSPSVTASSRPTNGPGRRSSSAGAATCGLPTASIPTAPATRSGPPPAGKPSSPCAPTWWAFAPESDATIAGWRFSPTSSAPPSPSPAPS